MGMAQLFSIIGFCALLSVTVAVRPLSAHEAGHQDGDVARVAARVIAVETSGQSLRVTLEMEAMAHAAILARVVAPAAATIGDTPKAHLPEGEPVQHTVAMAFAGEVPALFTLLLEFEDGQLGPVLVIPDFVSN